MAQQENEIRALDSQISPGTDRMNGRLEAEPAPLSREDQFDQLEQDLAERSLELRNRIGVLQGKTIGHWARSQRDNEILLLNEHLGDLHARRLANLATHLGNVDDLIRHGQAETNGESLQARTGDWEKIQHWRTKRVAILELQQSLKDETVR